ncbi:MAG TPA: hypothetical protein VGM20_03725 [Gemmatimonadales bacterium]|jgi:Tfp pilus assembly protein PilO
MTDGQQTAIIIVTIGCVTGLIFPIVRGVVQHAQRRAAPHDELTEDVAQLRDRVAELDAVSLRVQELEERVDFAERLLAQRTQAPELPAAHRTPV